MTNCEISSALESRERDYLIFFERVQVWKRGRWGDM